RASESTATVFIHWGATSPSRILRTINGGSFFVEPVRWCDSTFVNRVGVWRLSKIHPDEKRPPSARDPTRTSRSASLDYIPVCVHSQSWVAVEDTLKAGRPKLLFLAWAFPPAATIGAVRTWNTAKYLSRLGWDVTVVTPDPKLIRHAEGLEDTATNLSKEGI